MTLVDAGRNHIAGSITEIGGLTNFTNAAGHIGVGNSNTATTSGMTDLQGASKFREAMEATYPQLATNVLTFKSSFNDDSSQFDWEEWGVFNAVSAATMLNRKVESLGTKGAGQTWDFTVTLTVNIGT